MDSFVEERMQPVFITPTVHARWDVASEDDLENTE